MLGETDQQYGSSNSCSETSGIFAASGYTVYLSTGKVAVRTNSTTALTGATTIPLNVWTHIAATFNSSTFAFNIYVNGGG